MGVASRDLSEFALIYVFVEGLADRLPLRQPCSRCWRVRVLPDGNTVPAHLPPRTKEDAARLRKSLQGPAPGAACLICSLRVRHGPEEGRFGDYFMP
jgi:hypothetical protein